MPFSPVIGVPTPRSSTRRGVALRVAVSRAQAAPRQRMKLPGSTLTIAFSHPSLTEAALLEQTITPCGADPSPERDPPSSPLSLGRARPSPPVAWSVYRRPVGRGRDVGAGVKPWARCTPAHAVRARELEDCSRRAGDERACDPGLRELSMRARR